MPTDRLLDVAIVGAGISGIVHLHYAIRCGLDAMVLEKGDGLGGLWRVLPRWQDLQMGTLDWALGDLPMEGATQPHVLANIAAWRDRFNLSDRVQLACPVIRARHRQDRWELDTPKGPVHARHLVAATGAHNIPEIPEVDRERSTLREFHSSGLHDPAEITGRDVLVVGGGASAFDLLEKCFEHGANRVHWAYRGLRWFVPTNKPKTISGSLRPFAKMQASGLPIEQQSALIGGDLLARYEKFGLRAIQPERPFDVLRDQPIPGRAGMIEHFGSIERHQGSVVAIDGNEVRLTNGATVKPDLLLWGTGYRTDLTYFEDPRIASIRTVSELSSRCACIFRSLDAPNLYFTAVGLDGIGKSPWYPRRPPKLPQ